MVEDRLEGLCGSGSLGGPSGLDRIRHEHRRARRPAGRARRVERFVDVLEKRRKPGRAALGLVGRAHAGRHVRSILQRECRGAAGGDGAP